MLCGILRIFAGTWNVSQEKASPEALRVWLEEPAAGASLVCIGLQEMEMGAGSIGLAAVKETVSLCLSISYTFIHFNFFKLFSLLVIGVNVNHE